MWISSGADGSAEDAIRQVTPATRTNPNAPSRDDFFSFRQILKVLMADHTFYVLADAPAPTNLLKL